MVGAYFSICSIIILTIFVFNFFSKKYVKNSETNIYKFLLLLTLIGTALDVFSFCLYKFGVDVNGFLYPLISKLVFIYFLSWIFLFTYYAYLISKKSLIKINSNILKIVFSLLALCVLIAPLSFEITANSLYPIGLSVAITYGVVAVCLVMSIILIFENCKNMILKKYIPIFSVILMIILAVFLQKIFPDLFLINFSLTVVVIIMYFTMENPDVQVIELLMRNRELVEQSVNDKSNFLFKISQELKKPIKNIIKEIKPLKESVKDPSKLETINQIENNANSAYFIINDVTDISSMDVKIFKVQENTYMTERFFADVVLNVKNQMKNDNKDDKIEFNFKINSKCPDSLFGDNIKLKQILLSIINNSIKYTKEGFIDLEVDALVRYDACRFVFTISDSGCGMPLTVVNDLMSKNEEIDTIDYQKTDNLNLRIPVVSKILKILGGNININSKEGTGTTVTIVINQEINYDSTEIVLNDVKKYNTGIKVKQRVLVADDSDNFDKVERLISKYDVELIPTLIGRDVVDKIKNGDMFDLIILRDEMEPDSAYTILKELKSIDKFKIPVIIMINREKEFIKDEFIKDGFSDYIVYEKIDNDMDRVMKKYI